MIKSDKKSVSEMTLQWQLPTLFHQEPSSVQISNRSNRSFESSKKNQDVIAVEMAVIAQCCYFSPRANMHCPNPSVMSTNNSRMKGALRAFTVYV